MGAPREVTCTYCGNVFELEIPRSWVRCPSCGRGFSAKRESSRDVDQSSKGEAARENTPPDPLDPRLQSDADEEPMEVRISEVELRSPSAPAVKLPPPPRVPSSRPPPRPAARAPSIAPSARESFWLFHLALVLFTLGAVAYVVTRSP